MSPMSSGRSNSAQRRERAPTKPPAQISADFSQPPVTQLKRAVWGVGGPAWAEFKKQMGTTHGWLGESQRAPQLDMPRTFFRVSFCFIQGRPLELKIMRD